MSVLISDSQIADMADTLRRVWVEINGDDPYTERDWKAACTRWWEQVIEEAMLPEIREYVFGNGYRIRKDIEPVRMCGNGCDRPALPDANWCAECERKEQAIQRDLDAWAEQNGGWDAVANAPYEERNHHVA